MSDGVWQVCPSCGCVISDPELHAQFHSTIEALIAAPPAEQDGE